MPRLFVSHSSHDNTAAIAFKQWLATDGWPKQDVYLDLDSIGVGSLRGPARCHAISKNAI